MTNQILYLSFSKLEYSVNAVYIKGLEQNGIEVHKRHLNKRRWGEYISVLKDYWKNRKSFEAIVVGYNSPELVIWARLIFRQKIIYNALCSRYERFIVSRAVASRFSLKSFAYWLADFLAVHCANLVMLETNEQIKYFHQLFGVSKKKCYRAWTGVDEDKFFYDSQIQKPDVFTVIFRGGLLPESGAEYAVKVAKLLEKENVKFIMHANDQELSKIQKLIEELHLSNFKLMTEFLSDEELRNLMQRSHLSLGQLSNHARLARTVPHKAFESLALRLPYLTANNKGITELLKPGETCLVCNPADPQSLAEQIIWAKNHSQELETIAEKGYRLYQEKLTAKVLVAELLKRMRN